MSKQIGKRIRDAREEQHLTQEEVANQLGIGRAGLANIETGRNLITVDHLIKLPGILRRPVNYFLDMDIGELSQEEEELIRLYRSLPNGLPKEWALFLMREWSEKMEKDWEDFIKRHPK